MKWNEKQTYFTRTFFFPRQTFTICSKWRRRWIFSKPFVSGKITSHHKYPQINVGNLKRALFTYLLGLWWPCMVTIITMISDPDKWIKYTISFSVGTLITHLGSRHVLMCSNLSCSKNNSSHLILNVF